MDIMFIAILFVSAAMVGVTSLAASLDDGHWTRADYMHLVGRSISQIQFGLLKPIIYFCFVFLGIIFSVESCLGI